MAKRLISLILISLILTLPICFSTEISKSLNYDSNGNLVQDGDNYYEYNSLNHLIRVRDNDQNGRILEEYSYDPDGQRIKKVTYKEDDSQEIVYYIDENFVRIVNSSGTYDIKYYYHNGQLIAREDYNGDKYYYHPDHLGSTNVVTDENGDVVERTEYLPFGEALEGGLDRFTFTGQESDKATGLMYFGARYYSPFLRSFTQPDTILQDVYDPQTLNRYSYVRNNPLKYTDPSGHVIFSTLLAVGAALSYVAAITSPYWMPYLGATFDSDSINDFSNMFENPSVENVLWGVLAVEDIATKGIPEGKIVKGGKKLVDEGGSVIKKFFNKPKKSLKKSKISTKSSANLEEISSKTSSKKGNLMEQMGDSQPRRDIYIEKRPPVDTLYYKANKRYDNYISTDNQKELSQYLRKSNIDYDIYQTPGYLEKKISGYNDIPYK